MVILRQQPPFSSGWKFLLSLSTIAPVRPLGRQRSLALSIVIAGILTFFGSFVTIDPPVAGMTQWSPFKIVLQMYYGALPSPPCERCGEPLIRSILALPLMVTLDYVLMAAALFVLCFSRQSKAIFYIAIIGTCFSGSSLWRIATRLEFQETFYGTAAGGHVGYGALLVTHVVVMGALLLVSLQALQKGDS
jgi:phosphatidylglycerophosphate synthase